MVRVVLTAATTVAVVAETCCFQPHCPHTCNGVEPFGAFKSKFGKHYDGVEHNLRKEIFAANLEFIERENAKGHSYQLVVNEFADMTREEYRQRLGFRGKPTTDSKVHLGTHTYAGETLEDAVDWVKQGAVTPVKDQGRCGSCWAFSTTGSLEGAWEQASGKLVPLSEQQLVDCSKDNDGCDGGIMDTAFKFLEEKGSCTEKSYPYTAVGGDCKSDCTLAVPAGGVTGFKDVESSEESLMSALAKGPVSVAIEADQSAFSMYGGGVLTGTCGDTLDHGVLVVGYGEDNGQKYWKVKNSWGASWGENGYIRLERGLSGKGQCGILTEPSYPVVTSADDMVV